MKRIKFAKIPRKLGKKVSSIYGEFKQLKKDAKDEGINMFVELKGDMTEIKNVMVYRNKVNISLSESSDCSESRHQFTDLNESSNKSFDFFNVKPTHSETEASLIKF